MDIIAQLLPKTGLFRKILSLIAAISMLVSLVSGFAPEPLPRDEAQNIIFIIGDGMGENHLELAKQELGIELVMETMPLRGQSKTRSSSSAVTDSAAGATALACGVRTTNGCIGVYPYDMFGWEAVPYNLTEIAMEKGMNTGVITTDSTTGATPASFSAHTSSRGNAEDIAAQQIASGIDLIWGASNGITTPETAAGSGYAFIGTRTEMNTVEKGVKSYGQFNGGELWKSAPADDTPSLTQMAEKAISLLDGEEGFFLMIEGAHIDKHSHGNKTAEAAACVQELDNTVKAAVDFAEEDGNTLVIVTADHETGAVEFVDGRYAFTSGSHSSDNVPLFVYGSSNFIENGQTVKNKEVALFAAMSMGVPANEFPKKNYTVWIMDEAA